MKSASMVGKSLSISLLIVSLVFLPGCGPLDWLKKQFGTEKVVSTESKSSSETAAAGDMDANVLVSMDGKPVVTMDMLEQNYRQVIEERPDLAKLEGCVKESLLQGLVRQAIVDRYVEESNLSESAAYVKDRDIMAETCRKILNVKYFKEAHPVAVKESEVKEYYEANKDTFPDLILERGGIETMAVAFDKEADAKAFLAKAKAAPKDFEKMAKEHKDKFRDYKHVNARSPEVDPAIKNAVLELKSFPEIKLVQAGNTHWVVNAMSKRDSKYRPFDEQIKEGLRQYMIQEREARVMDEEMTKLKDKYGVKVNAAALNQTAQAEFNIQDMLGMMGADQMAEAESGDASAQAANQPAQVA
jgi:hypothetical protein